MHVFYNGLNFLLRGGSEHHAKMCPLKEEFNIKISQKIGVEE